MYKKCIQKMSFFRLFPFLRRSPRPLDPSTPRPLDPSTPLDSHKNTTHCPSIKRLYVVWYTHTREQLSLHLAPLNIQKLRPDIFYQIFFTHYEVGRG